MVKLSQTRCASKTRSAQLNSATLGSVQHVLKYMSYCADEPTRTNAYYSLQGAELYHLLQKSGSNNFSSLKNTSMPTKPMTRQVGQCMYSMSVLKAKCSDRTYGPDQARTADLTHILLFENLDVGMSSLLMTLLSIQATMQQHPQQHVYKIPGSRQYLVAVPVACFWKFGMSGRS